MPETSININGEELVISKSDVEEAFRQTEESLDDENFEMRYSPWHFVEMGRVRKPLKWVFLNVESVSEVADSRQAFSTPEAKEVLEELEISLYSRKEHAGEIFRDTLEEILEDYSDRPDRFSGEARIYKLLDKKAPNFAKHIVNKETSFEEKEFEFEGSAGQGNWANTPWVAVLHPDETDTTQQGVYVVYLFDPENKVVYATLNQGVTELEDRNGRRDAREILEKRAEEVRDNVKLEGFSTEQPEFSGGIGEMYGPSTIYQKKYELDNMPSAEEIERDLVKLTEAYSKYVRSDSSEKLGKDITHLAEKYSAEYDQDYEKVEESIERFQSKFPEKEIKNLSIDEWAPRSDNPNKEDAVYYWLQYETQDVLGSFAPGYANNYVIRYKDGELIDHFDSDPESTFEEMKSNFVKALDLLDSGDYSAIDSLDPLPTGSIMLRWFVFYRLEKIIPIYSKGGLDSTLDALELEKPSGYFSKNKKLLDYKNSYEIFSDWNNYKFMRFIWDYQKGIIGPDQRDNTKVEDSEAQPQTKIDVEQDISTELNLDFNELYFHEDVEESIRSQIKASLNSGKHIIFTGPPGTGKTELAEKVAEEMEDTDENVTGFQLTTATSDWSTFDTVGGYRPKNGEDGLEFKPGHILRRFRDDESDLKNEALVIDEINRADIDKAFGQLFTVLSGQKVQLPFTKGEAEKEVEVVPGEDFEKPIEDHEFIVPESWRILATMNTYDKTSLYEMSYAFMRRFSFIRVEAPKIPEDIDKRNQLMDKYIQAWDLRVGPGPAEAVGEIWYRVNNAVEGREIGPAIAKDMLEFLNESGSNKASNTAAITNFIFPQLEGVPERKEIVDSLVEVSENKKIELDRSRLERIASSMLGVNISGEE